MSAVLSNPLSQLFGKVLERYRFARQNLEFAGHHEISEYFEGIKSLLGSAEAVSSRKFIKVVSSYGKGVWATIPWVSLLDTRQTTSTQRGTYVVYLFREDGKGMYIKLAQGVTKAEKELGSGAFQHLAQKAQEIRQQILYLTDSGFDLSGKSDLGTSHKKAKLYEASTIAAKYYSADALPSDEVLLSDLSVLLDAYESISPEKSVDEEKREVALVGTWTSIKGDIGEVLTSIATNGGWASPWSFRVKPEAISRLSSRPFWLYINEGGNTIVARARVETFACSDTPRGMLTPWPEITGDEWLSEESFGDGPQQGIKTWLKLTSIELVPPFHVSELQAVEGLSTSASVINRNAFGYVYEGEMARTESRRPFSEPARSVSPRDEPPEATPRSLEWLKQETLLDEATISDLLESLRSKRPQILLAGPPGTSKTWVARKLAEYLTAGRPDAVRLVQFHPSYTYESFIEGLRPKATSGGVSFELTPGVVLEMVRTIERRGHLNDAANPYVLILDEANRANLPRVLGELLFLFEYRGERAELQYSGNFRLPSNLLFIGTMNTADRSIRTIDAALRRRFDVFELGPSGPLLQRHLDRVGQPPFDLVSGFNSLNAALAVDIDRHHTIGHSFFMEPSLTRQGLNRIWQRKIFPLIDEYFFDQADIAATYSIERFWSLDEPT